jgi:hypothetical protein
MKAARDRRLGAVALVLLALAWALLIQAPGANQNAHFALVRSLADGTPQIDRYRNETGDTAYVGGHYYAAKAPGLALATLPWYVGLRQAGLTVPDTAAHKPWPRAQAEFPRTAIWEVGLFGATVPAFLLLVLVRAATDRLVPGFGTAAAVALGAGSLLGILATLFFAHALSSLLGFAAFSVLLWERKHPPHLWLVAAAGGLGGLAVVVELPLAIVASAVGLYAIARPFWQLRLLAYSGGVFVGLLPLAAFNVWAFGSPTRLSYANAVSQPGRTGHEIIGANSSGFFGVGTPSPHHGLDLLFSSKGLLVLTPLWALSAVGLIALWHDGSRIEAAVVGGIGGAFLLYDASYYQPFGGFPPGPRFLVPMLPFLAIAIAAAWRALPAVTLAFTLASIAVTSAALVTEPLDYTEGAAGWFHRLEHGEVTRTVFGWAWRSASGAEAILVLLLVTAALAISIAVTPRPRISIQDLVLACLSLVGWRIVYVGAPIMLNVDRARHGWTGASAVICLALAIVLVLVLVARGRTVAVVPGLALAPIALPRFAAHTGVSLAAVGIAVVGLLALTWRPRRHSQKLDGVTRS